MTGTRATQPMSAQATSAADDDFYRAHPEMVCNGQRIPIDPYDPQQAGLRREWMASYEGHGGKVTKLQPKHVARKVRRAKSEANQHPANVGTVARSAHCPDVRPQPPDVTKVVTAPKPGKPPVSCKLVSADVTCEHGRHPSPEGLLCVVPTDYKAIGDSITCVAQSAGGCGQHVQWSIEGMWTSTEIKNSTKFNAKTFKPALLGGWLLLHRVDPQVYRATATSCEGGPRVFEIRSYPPDKLSYKIDFSKLYEAIHKGLKLVPLEEKEKVEIEKSLRHFFIEGEEQWKEDKKTPRAFCEAAIRGGGDLLPKLEITAPIYPLNLVPAGLQKWLKAGVYVTFGAELSLKVGMVWKYWPEEREFEKEAFDATLSGEVELKLSINLYVVSKDVVNGEVAGGTTLKAELKGMAGHGVRVEGGFVWGGIVATITLQAAWGFIEYKRTYPILEEQPFGHFEHDFSEASSGE